MTNQEVYDKVKAHLLKQGKRSSFFYWDGGEKKTEKCALRGQVEDDKCLKCAVGCLIPDELYNTSLEGFKSYEGPLPKLLLRLGTDVEFVSVLEQVHDGDDNDPEDWERLLTEVAERWGLNP